jgi:hypothetical protein
MANAKGIRYGSVGVELKIHDGRIMGKVYSITETHRDRSGRNEAGDGGQDKV